MKSKRMIGALLSVAIVTPVFAGPVGIQRNAPSGSQVSAIAALEAAREQVARERLGPNARGTLQVRYMTKQARLESLIERLKRGERVSPEEIDQVLGN